MNAQGDGTADHIKPEMERPMKSFTPGATELPPPATYGSSRGRCNRGGRRRCVYTISGCICMSFVLTIGITVLVEWLIIRPQNGNYDLQDAQLKTLKLSQTGNGNASLYYYDLDTDLALQFLFSNPNHVMGFDIKGFNAYATYSGYTIGQSADVPPFHQPKRNETRLASEMNSVTAVLSQTVGDGLLGKTNVTLFVEMSAKVRNNQGLLTNLHPYRGVHLRCFVNLMVPLNASAPGHLISKSCITKRDGIL